MLARRTQASALAIVSSKSLDKRRQRLSQANVRSTTQRFGSGLNVPLFSDRVTISINHLPNSASAWGQLLAAVHAVSKDVTQLGKDEANVFQQWDRAVDVLDIGLMHLQCKH